MKRRLFTILSALSLLLCLATAIMWGIAQWKPHRVAYRDVTRQGAVVRFRDSISGWDRYGLLIWSCDTDHLYGQTYDRLFRLQGVATMEDIAEAERIEHLPNAGPSVGPFDGHGFICRLPESGMPVVAAHPPRVTVYGRYGLVLVIPFYELFMLSLLFPAARLLVWATRRRRELERRRMGLCPACGYDLRASKDCCPECGTPVPPDPATRMPA